MIKSTIVLAMSCLALFGIVSWALFVPDASDDQAAVYFGWLGSSAVVGFLGVLLIPNHLVQRVITVLLVANSSVAAVVMARVIRDCLQYPTAHNLWPFEVIIACIVVTFGVGLGASAGTIGVVFNRIAEKRNDGEHSSNEV